MSASARQRNKLRLLVKASYATHYVSIDSNLNPNQLHLEAVQATPFSNRLL
ncbi:hypothetical protein [Scytonema sp. NUACC26]|uniref:hypothetical protein n=1 Tax=Scytonema sp. NUACC26 TaxID=3140176 RepID=UPI0038B2CA70